MRAAVGGVVEPIVEVAVLILLEEAIERYSFAAGDFGIRPVRRRKHRQAARQIADLERRLPGLRIPEELRGLWMGWTPESFGSLFFDGLYRLDEVLGIHDRDAAVGFPRLCLPLAYIEKAGVWIELETTSHPGGRVYHTYYEEGLLKLWCVGLSDLFHLVSETIERGGVNESVSTRPFLDFGVFETARLELTSELLAMPDEWRVGIGDKSAWPRHWREADGVDDEKLELRGRSHTVAEFDQARERGRITGTLVGEITGLVAGGPVDGTVANFTDETGSIQVYASVEVERAIVGLEVGVRREIDVIGEPSARGLRPDRGTRDFMLRRDFEELSANQLRLLEQMRKLDISVAVTAVRPIP